MQSSLGSLAPPPPLAPRVAIAIAGLLATVFVVSHVSLVPATLDGIDSTNFMLAIDGYDPKLHQPHPPGFPVHVALGRAVTAAYRAVVPGEDEIGTVAASLRIWSVMCGGLAVLAMTRVALGIGISSWGAALATALVTLCPLFWITALRPLSDVPGFLFALMSQALALSASNRNDPMSARVDYRWLASAFIAGIAAGVRVQTTLLTVPLLGVLTVMHARAAGWRIVSPIAAAFVVGVLVWAVPLTLALGGPQEYLRLLTTVAADDVQGVEMLATDLSPRLLALALVRTFIVPWGSTLLGTTVVALALVGACVLLIANRRAALLALVMGAPYLLFHLFFQETASIRYALPVVPVTAVFVAGVLRLRTLRLALAIVTAIMASAATTSVAAATAYAHTESPVARALAASTDEAGRRPEPPTLAFHHSVGQAIRGEEWPGRILGAPVRYEWLEVARHWLEGHHDVVWFLADGRRTDLALVDPASRHLMEAYQWPLETRALLGGIQPPYVRWYELDAPGWFLMRGWALTPETRGVSTRDQNGAGSDGALGYIRRRQAPAMMLIGGRNLGGPCDTAARVEVRIDGRAQASWTVPSRSRFLQRIALPAGALAGPGEYAEVKVVATDVAPEGRAVDVALTQFNVQSSGGAISGFDRGWHMTELDADSGVTWRWTEQVAELHLDGFGRDLQLAIRGESPLKYFQEAPHVRIAVGDVEIGAFRPTDDFQWTMTVPAAALAAANGRVTISVDRSFVPDQVSGNGDQRQLALRIYDVSATAPGE